MKRDNLLRDERGRGFSAPVVLDHLVELFIDARKCAKRRILVKARIPERAEQFLLRAARAGRHDHERGRDVVVCAIGCNHAKELVQRGLRAGGDHKQVCAGWRFPELHIGG